MIELIVLAAVLAAAYLGYRRARGFVRERLRYVDGIHKRRTPWVWGGLAALVALPLTWLLPVVGAGSALLFGVGVGLGISRGAHDIRRGDFPVTVVNSAR